MHTEFLVDELLQAKQRCHEPRTCLQLSLRLSSHATEDREGNHGGDFERRRRTKVVGKVALEREKKKGGKQG